MKKKMYVNFDCIFLKCLRIADITKLSWSLITYIKEKTFILEKKGYQAGIDYNEDQIDYECFNGKNHNKTKRGMEHLASKNIITYDVEERKIRINYNPMTWYLKNEQYDEIEKVINDDKFYINVDE